MDADRLRRAFLGFFEERDHTVVPSSSLIPHHPTAPLFTNAGMNQFVPYFLGEEPAPYPRAASVQKCVRTADIDVVGTTTRHCTFFEMLGNFSFGDYFKEGAIRLAWKLAVEVLGYDGDRIWATVHDDDDEAEQLWIDAVGLPPERVQRRGDEDNFWEMQKGAPGPCGPNSELYYDRGAEHGAGGGPAHGSEERFLEFWNLVFMEFQRRPDGTLVELPTKNVDTGAGFERNLVLLQGVDSVFDTDVMWAIREEAERLTGCPYGRDERTDVSLRIMTDHARAVSFLVSDGVFPSNEDRGYVLRRLIRRAVRHAHLLGVDKPVTPELVAATVSVMGDAYPDLAASAGFVTEVVGREEERFRETLKTGSVILDEALGELGEGGRLGGDVAFRLHDTYGFPLEVTQEIAAERGVEVDVEAFETAMAEQRRRAKAARRSVGPVAADPAAYRELLDRHGPTEFVGYDRAEAEAEVLAVLPAGDGKVEVFLDRSPFYAEGGGQVGDTGTLRTDRGVLRIIDTTPAVAGLHRHLAEVVEGEVEPGDTGRASIDAERRAHTQRNHTGTHLLHAALRTVLGTQVRQQGSYVGPDRLRFDINHHAPLTPDELAAVEELVNDEVLSNHPVRAFQTTMDEAREMGALMFFGDKYGDIVRVVEAGPRSLELCGGTHEHALGGIGPLKIVSEGSIGSNLRRVEAVTGTASLTRIGSEERTLVRVAELLRSSPDEVYEAVERLLARQRQLDDELKALRSAQARNEAGLLAATAVDGAVVARRDGLGPDQLRDLAVATRDAPGVHTVVLVGSPDGERVSVVGAVAKGRRPTAGELAVAAAKAVGGGGNPKAEDLAVAGGRDPDAIDAAIAVVRHTLGLGGA